MRRDILSFNSVLFLICLPFVIILYWIIPQRFKWIMLLIVSYAFYMSWNAWLIFLILFTTVISYFSGILMEKYNSKKIKRICMIVTVICCLGVLFFFKYFTFAVNIVIDLINIGSANIAEYTFSLILPVGISFYTFQTLSYVIDIYRGNIGAERHFGYYALFVTYFPQLVAGPIERPENLIPQLKAEHKFEANDLCIGLRTALIGYVKKIVIADGVAVFVNAVYNNVSAANGLSVIIATILFAVQIYCDFSGYTDIAVGVARMMGIKLSDNFNQPYLATSIKDFWRRWHISLTSWFTDYVYIPLGGNRCRFWRWALNVMIVFLLSGLWHGAALTFIVWGGIHGVYQIVGRVKNTVIRKLSDKGKIKLPKENTLTITVKRIITFLLVCFAWIFFRGNSLTDCGILIAKIFTDWSGGFASLKNIGLNFTAAIGIILMIAVLAISPRVIKLNEYNVALNKSSLIHSVAYTYMVIAVAVAWIALLSGGGESSFIYFQF